ncbi:TerB family tellurite resistance protein [Sinisalibacter aestuarii]|uniref:Co-chaperone DjlA N-terminal domain-containing protein n=1 Tax=Sinisalibacter aestuarii TaxID=2949426 RepID=A0ABQ5LWB1_9RHOB|nr:TerB family tellurite resistance protein [Sinisalibacter aestuarii]GKY88641.1 hypothetical protein STA1M1_25100 [Sinisalibacter aestuarii]
MFNALIARLKGHPKDKPLPALDVRLAMAALLVRMAKADEHYAFEEIAEIDTILARAHGLNPVEAAKLRADAERIEAAGPDTADFIAEVQGHTPYEDRAALFGALWDVGLADRALQPQEEAFLTGLGAALGLSPADAADTARRHDKPDTQP